MNFQTLSFELYPYILLKFAHSKIDSWLHPYQPCIVDQPKKVKKNIQYRDLYV